MKYVYVIIDNHREYFGTYASKEAAIDGILDLYHLNEGLNTEHVELQSCEIDENRIEVIVEDKEQKWFYGVYSVLREEVKE